MIQTHGQAIFTSKHCFCPKAYSRISSQILRTFILNFLTNSAHRQINAFVISRVNYCKLCNALYAGSPKAITDKLQRVLNAATRVSDTRKFDHGLSALHDEFVGWTCQKELPTSLSSWCIVVCTVKHLSTSTTISLQLLTSLPGPFCEPTTTSRTPLST